MNIPDQLVDAVTVLAWMVVFALALGIAEISVNLMDSIITKVKRWIT